MRAGMPGLDWTPILRTPVFEIAALLFGLVVGSFANVCIHRLPQDYEPTPGRLGPLRDLWRQAVSVVHPGSHCPRCGRAIRPWDNVPVLSWLWLRGRCRACALPIAIRYPAVEAANGLLWLGLALAGGPRLQTLVAMLFVTVLLILVLIDLEHQLLPDVLTLPGTAIGIAASFLPGARVAPLHAAAAALGGYLCFALLAWLWRRLRGIEALGQGDWKMAALLGAFLGSSGLLLTVLIASAAGSLVGVALIVRGGGGWQSRLPFGSFLGAAGIVAVFAADGILSWYGARLLDLYRALHLI
jgi:leader peptidase (prepilin peptidase) / N-methyltransferase